MIDFLFPVALFFVFTVSALAILLLAANIYQSTTEHSARNYTAGTSLSYISEKIRQNNEAGAISLGELDGCEALIIRSEYEQATYYTYIYVYDRELKELFAREDTAASPSLGRSILSVEDFSMEQVNDGLFLFTCTDTEGQTASTLVSSLGTQ
jgi:hypothetical protein